MYEYSWFSQKVKEHALTEPNRDAAITQAIQDCIRTRIFAEYMQKHGSEAVNMLFARFNLESAKKSVMRKLSKTVKRGACDWPEPREKLECD